MRTQTVWTRIFVTAAVLASGCAAQGQTEPAKTPTAPNVEEQKFFHFEFVVKELDGAKVVNSRSYSMNVATGNDGSMIRSGNKVPDGNNYLDVGTNIDCSGVREVGSELSTRISVDISNTVTDPGSSGRPVIRQVRWNSRVLIPVGKPTVIFSSDDPASTHQMQLQVTASPIK